MSTPKRVPLRSFSVRPIQWLLLGFTISGKNHLKNFGDPKPKMRPQSARPQSAPSVPKGAGAPIAKPSREERRMGKREKQLAAENAKAEAEARYFKECQQQAQRSGEARAAQQGATGAEADAREAALFAKQGAQGIEFGKESPKVEVSGPGSDAAPPLVDFGALGKRLPPYLARNIDLMRYRTPTPIQQHAVPLALAGCDLMCCAQTGSGKTAAFLVPVCAALTAAGAPPSTVGTAGAARPRAVVMAPTRELASQIDLEAQKLTNRSALRPVCVYGGADQRAQASGGAPDVAVACACMQTLRRRRRHELPTHLCTCLWPPFAGTRSCGRVRHRGRDAGAASRLCGAADRLPLAVALPRARRGGPDARHGLRAAGVYPGRYRGPLQRAVTRDRMLDMHVVMWA